MKSNGVLSERAATTLLHEVFNKELDLMGGQVINLGNPEVRKLRCFLFENNYLEKESLRHLIHKQLLACGKKMYRTHADSMQDGQLITFPDHLMSPHALGYAIKCGTVHPVLIRFDHGETAKEYMNKAEGLLNGVINQLLEPYVPRDDTVSPGFGVEACCAG